MQLSFVEVDPTKKIPKSAKREIRRHATADRHAKARQKRVEAYQKSQPDVGEDGQGSQSSGAAGERFMSAPVGPLRDHFGSHMPNEQRLLLDHYLNAASITPELPWLLFCTPELDKRFRDSLLQLAFSQDETMNAVLLVASRALCHVQNHRAHELEMWSLRYKSAAIRGLGQRVAKGRTAVGVADVVTAVCLALDDTTQEDWTAAAAHVLGVVRLLDVTTGICRQAGQKQLCEEHVEWLMHKIICSTHLAMDPRFLLEGQDRQVEGMEFLKGFMVNHEEYVRVMG